MRGKSGRAGLSRRVATLATLAIILAGLVLVPASAMASTSGMAETKPSTYRLDRGDGGGRATSRAVGAEVAPATLSLDSPQADGRPVQGAVDEGLPLLTSQATFNDINAPGVWLKQSTEVTCTLTSAAMMLRRAAMMNGNPSWSSITEASLRGTAWVPGVGLGWSFSYAGLNVSHATLPGGSANVSAVMSLLSSHQEGIVLYNGSHAVLLTDHVGDAFYCADPATGYPSGRIAIDRCLSVRIANATAYWYVSSPVDPLEPDVPVDPDSDHNPRGVLDAVVGGEGIVRVTGWAFDADDPSVSVSVHVYIGGDAASGEGHVIAADLPSQDVNDVFGIGGAHRFDATIETGKRGDCAVHVYAINMGRGTTNPHIGASSVRVIAAAPVEAASIPAGQYVLRSKLGTNKVIDVSNSSHENGGNVALREWNGANNQKWDFRNVGGSTYAIAAVHSGKVLDVSGGGFTDGENVQQWEWYNVFQQRWYVVGNGDGSYRLRAMHSGMVLGVQGGASADAANVIQGAWAGETHQSWYLMPVDASRWVITDAQGDQGHTYTGGAITPELTVSSGGYVLVEGTDYTLSCQNNVEVGTATVTVTGMNGYAGSQSTTFRIVEATQQMQRLYNPNSGEHFYTGDANERDGLMKLGWVYEGVGWVAPVSSGVPVYRLYNPNAGDHHYTLLGRECDALVEQGWVLEGIGWYSAGEGGAPLYRLYNPNTRGAGAHHYTTSASERDDLVRRGWVDEGVGWYGVR